MPSIQEKIKEIEEEIRRTPYNKATQHHIGRLKAKLARLKEESEKRSGRTSGPSFGVKKSGNATVVLVGFPSVGKSTLLNRLTNAASQVGEYDFTTFDVIPGVMEYTGARIQILDVPGLIEGAASGRGRGREVISVVRNADLILIMLDIFNLHQLEVVEKELYRAGIRLDRKPPDVRIKKRSRGGINVSSTVSITEMDLQTIKAVLSEYKFHNASVVIRGDITVDELIDVIAKNRIYIESIAVINKIDLASNGLLRDVEKRLPEGLQVSAGKDINLAALREKIFKKLNFIHVYMKPQGKEADLEEPLIIKESSTVGDVCQELHRDFKRKFRFARVWGSSVRFEGQRVGLDHVLKDEDIVSLVLEK
ncbi:MAG: OBG GTPase family GTP-binding protein [Candidatus Hydrothermarchaeales archaeon]